jgi:hypothetical protein
MVALAQRVYEGMEAQESRRIEPRKSTLRHQPASGEPITWAAENGVGRVNASHLSQLLGE